MGKFKKITSLVATYIFIVTMILSNINYKVLATTLNENNLDLETIGGQVIVKVKDLNDTSYKAIIDKYQGKELDIYDNYLLVELDNSKIDDFKNEIKLNQNVDFVENNAVGQQSTVALDELSSSQDYIFDTNAIEAWGAVTAEMKKAEIKVAIIDSGIKASHQDLAGKIDTANGYNFVSNNTNADDDNGHGTNVAGVIAANHNGVGINGIAGQLNVKLLPIKVLDKNGVGTTLNIAKGIKYAADKGASLINVSINGKGFSKAVDDAIKYALSKGALVVASAGNKGEYADNYWPCNSEGVFVVGSNDLQKGIIEEAIYPSNIGDRIDISVESKGISTGITSEGYNKVNGTSISSAIVTGTMALVKAKNTKITNDELKNIIKNSVVSGGRANNIEGLSIKEAIGVSSNFIEVISPASAEILSGDVLVDVLALKPNDVATVKYYLNDDTTPYATITGNGTKNYNATIKYQDLINGINKIEIAATDKAGNTYKEERYFKSSNNSTTLTISIKDKSGNPYKGLLVKRGYNMEVLTDENGEVEFLNVDPLEMNNIIITSGNADAPEKIYYTTNIVGAGKRIIDFSKDTKELKINALKNDNKTPLSNANVRMGTTQLGSDFKLDGNGSINLITNNTGNLSLAVYSSEEGYLYTDNLDLGNTSSKTFGNDSTVSKIDYTNIYDSKIGAEGLLLSTSDNLYYGIGLNIKNKPAYITKGEYNLNYVFSDLNKSQISNYYADKQSLSENKSISFIKPEIALENYAENRYELSLKNNEYKGKLDRNTSLTFEVLNPSGNKLEINKDYTISYNDGYSDILESFKLELINKPKGLYKFKVMTNYYGENIQSQYYTIDHLGNIGEEVQNGTLSLKFNLPADLIKVISDKKDGLDIKYEIYDKSNKNIIAQGQDGIYYRDINNFKFTLPEGVDGLNNNIYVKVSSRYGGVILDRYLEKATNGNIVLDCNNSNVKKISIKNNSGLDINKSTFEINMVGKDNSYFKLSQYAKNVNDLNFWVDKNNKYELSIYNDKLFLVNEGTISDSNSNVTISNNFGKVKFNYQKDSYIKAVSLELAKEGSENVYRMPSTNVKNELIISSGYNLSNLTYSFKSISNWMLGKGVNSEYKFSTKYNILKDSTKTIDLTNLKLQYNNAPQSVMYNEGIELGISLSNDDLKLIDYQNTIMANQNNTDYDYDYNERMSFYNEKGKLVKKIDSRIYGINSIHLYNVDANPGVYTAKLELIGLKANNQGFNITVSENNTVKLRIMDPFDTTKPLEDAVVKFGGKEGLGRTLKTDRDGYVLLDKNLLSESVPIKVIASKDGVPIIFKTPKNTYTKSETISVPISAIKLVNIKPKDYNGKVSIANKKVEVREQEGYYSSIASLLLDKSGNGKLYTNMSLDNLLVISDEFTLSTKYTGTGDIIFDNVNLGLVNVNFSVNYHNPIQIENTKTGEVFSISKSGKYYLSPGNYNYRYNKDIYNYYGNVDIVSGGTKQLQFGEKITNVITTPKSKVEVGEEVFIKVDSKDEYGNKVSYNRWNVDLIVSQNGIEVERYKNPSYYEEGTYKCKLNTIAESFNAKLEITMNDGSKITTNDLAFSMNLLNYKKVNVKAPNGDSVTSGKLIITRESGANTKEVPIIAGITYIDKNYLSQESNYNVFGKTNKDEYVLYGDMKVNDSTTEIKGKSLNKAKFNVSIPKNIESEIRFEILKKKNDIEYYSMDIVNEQYYGTSINDFIEKYNNKNIYVDGSEFFIKANYYKYNNGNNRYMLAQVANNKTTNINLDSNNVSKISIANPEGYKANSVELNTSWATLYVDDLDYVSKNVFDSYKFYVNNNNAGSYQNYTYSKKLTTPINTDNYIINYGIPSKLVAETTDNLVISKDNNITAKLYAYDNYENQIDIGYGSSKYMNITVDGKKLEKRYVHANNYDGYIEIDQRLDVFGKNIDISYSMESDGKVIESNTIKYTMDLSNYTAILAKDPLGQPLISGQMNNYYDCRILDGYLYIDNQIINDMDGNYNITGVNANGDRVIYKNYPVNKDTKEIKDATLSSYTINLDKASFGNVQSIEYSLINKDYFYGSHIDNFQQSGDEIKKSLKYFVKENNYDLIVEANTIDTTYVTVSKMGKYYSNCNIVNNATVNVDHKSAKYRVDNLYYSLDNSVYSYEGELDTNKKIYMAPDVFYINEARITEEYENGSNSSRMEIKDSFVGNEDKTILIGSEEIYNVKLKDLLYLEYNDNIFTENNVSDEYGNKYNSYNNYSIRYIGENYDSGDLNNAYSLPDDITEGIYTVELTINKNSNNPSKIIQENVKVASRNNIIYDWGWNLASYKLYKSNKEVDAGFNKDRLVILSNSNIIDDTDYRLDSFVVNKESYDNESAGYYIYNRSESAYVNSGQLYTDYNNYNEISKYKVNNAKQVSIYGEDGLKIENISTENLAVYMNLIKGKTYTVEALVDDASGLYLLSKTFVANNSLEDYEVVNFDKTPLKKITIDSGIKGKTIVNNLNLTYSNGKVLKLNEVLNLSKGLYLPTGTYDITMDLINYSLGVSTYKKNITIGSSNVVIPVGKNISYEVGLNKDIYNPNEEIQLLISNFKDKDAINSYLIDKKLKNIKIDLMHGNKVVTSFNNMLPESLKGECTIRVRGENDLLGEIASKNISITINNDKDILVGDINLDSYVDIFDLVYISNDIDKVKGVDNSFDSRVNLDNSNNKIDIADLAKAAINYSR